LIHQWRATLALIVMGFAAGACAATPDAPDAVFACAHDRRFEVRYTGADARLMTVHGVYELSHGASSIGRRFASRAATLVIDDDNASLVVDGEPRYVRCRKLQD